MLRPTSSSRARLSAVEAHDYVVDGKPALKWVMERQAVTPIKTAELLMTLIYGQPKP